MFFAVNTAFFAKKDCRKIPTALCFSLAREPIEVFRGLGYETVLGIYNNKSLCPEPYKIGKNVDITFDPKLDLQYPADAELFQRRIDLTYNKSKKYINIKVTIMPKIEYYTINI